MQIIKSIQNRIYEVQGERVMLDFDLALLYEVETKVLNQAVKRNIKRFPADFMFQLTATEWETIQLQKQNESLLISSYQGTNRSQIVTGSQKHRSKDYLPYVFTEQGIAMLSGVLNSDKAINMNISIMRAFIDIRKIVLKQGSINEHLAEIKERIGEHDVQLNELYDAMENLIDEKIAQLKWKDRERIGFKIKE